MIRDLVDFIFSGQAEHIIFLETYLKFVVSLGLLSAAVPGLIEVYSG